MRNSSAANSAASSPPVPARTSRIALRSSSASFGHERHPHPHFELGQALAQRLHLLLGHRLHLRVVAAGHLGRRFHLRLRPAQRGDGIDDRRQLAVFLRQFGEIGAAEMPLRRHRLADLGVAAGELIEAGFEGSVHHCAVSAFSRDQLGQSNVSYRHLSLLAAIEIAQVIDFLALTHRRRSAKRRAR
jgi:hypothetical protein